MTAKFSPRDERLIASFRGFPNDNGAFRDRGSKPLGSLLEACIEKYKIGKNTPEETILENWPRIVGAAFAGRCHPERIDRSGALIVQVPNAIVRRELMFSENKMLTVIASLPDCHIITRIVLKSG